MLLIFISAILSGLASSLLLKDCNEALGLTNGKIRDDQLSASSSFDSESTGPQHARARTHTGSGAWCPLNQVNSTQKEWIQITFARDTVVTAVEVQGRYDEGRGMEFARAFKIEYWRPNLQGWASYKSEENTEIIPGNSDTYTAELRVLDAPIVVRRLRIVPLSNSTRTVCLRLEVFGCIYDDPLQSYTAPVGSKANGIDFGDSSYDGSTMHSISAGGLGRLSDGMVGEETEITHPHRWVGWRRQTSEGGYVKLLFTFGELRNFSSINLHTLFSRKLNAKGFSRIIVTFSANGADFSSRIHEYIPEELAATSWIHVPIFGRIASTVQLRLYYPLDSSWICLSEVRFASKEVRYDLLHFDDDHSDSVTYFAVDEPIPDGRLGTMVLLCLLFLALVFPITVFCLYRKRDKIRTSSPPHGTHLTFDGTVFKSVSPSTYQMTRDNMENTLLEKCPMIVIASEYAEPDFGCTKDKAALEPLLSSFQNHGLEISHYAETVIPNAAMSNPLSSAVKYSDYGASLSTGIPSGCCEATSTSQEEENAFLREIRVLGNLKHPNVVEVIGVSTIDKPMICIMEYMAGGDLKSYISKMENVDTFYCISVATQLAAGLSYLESCNFVHRDIAARNCLVDDEGNVKIADFGMARSLYSNDYYQVEGQFVLPIRWMAWESLLLGKFSTHSDVWSFGVTLWEIFARCREKPYSSLADDQVLDNIHYMSSHATLKHELERPPLCPAGVFSKVLQPCWQYEPHDRPSFEALHLQLQMLIHTQTT
ncbi:unnamed protein product [Cylicocyclus nassatus]|uniref:receptor protein-tyrosine kinase n=1 Tax=Cylicocyclus nassatus TaxID=53992 RepID=A0AA36H2I8_CYLNA|nr:unnamed protein product [Cylicocyclus nassatus]